MARSGHVQVDDPTLPAALFAAANMNGYGSYQYPPAQEQQYDAEAWSGIDPSLALGPARTSTPSTPLTQAWHGSQQPQTLATTTTPAYNTHSSAYYGGLFSHPQPAFQENAYPNSSGYAPPYNAALLDPSLAYSSSTPPTTSAISRPPHQPPTNTTSTLPAQALQSQPSFVVNSQPVSPPHTPPTIFSWQSPCKVFVTPPTLCLVVIEKPTTTRLV